MSQNHTTWKPLTDSELHHIQNHRPSVRSTEASYLLQSIATRSIEEPTSLYPRLAALITSSPLVRDQVTIDATQTPAKSAVLQDLHNTAPATHQQDLALPAAVTYAAQGNYRAAMQLINYIPTRDADGPWRETITQARLTMASPKPSKRSSTASPKPYHPTSKSPTPCTTGTNTAKHPSPPAATPTPPAPHQNTNHPHPIPATSSANNRPPTGHQRQQIQENIMEQSSPSPVEKAFDAAIKEHEAAQTGPVTPIPDLRIGPPPTQTPTPDKGQEDK